LLFSDKVKKINMYDWNQERILVVTSKSVYNFKKQKIKRVIPIVKIGGISKTILQGSKNEFTIHVPSEYDYRFISDR